MKLVHYWLWFIAIYCGRIEFALTLCKVKARSKIVLAQSLQEAALDVNSIDNYRNWIGCISYREAKKILTWKQAASDLDREGMSKDTVTLETSINLGYSSNLLVPDNEGIRIFDDKIDNAERSTNCIVTWDELADISRKKNACFALYDDGSKPWQISTISKTSGRPASLCPANSLVAGDEIKNAPTLLLGGFTMHRITGENMNPLIDTEAKLASIKPLYFHSGANILDTCMGLGYTCIGAARKLGKGSSGRVTTVELDDASIEMSAYNPWSQQLFDGTLPIDILQGDVCDLIKYFPSSSLDLVIHDPPARALCESDLYGLVFYQELFRALKKPNGCLFHYIGNPASKESGRLYKGIISRLKEAGFRSVDMASEAFGLIAYT